MNFQCTKNVKERWVTTFFLWKLMKPFLFTSFFILVTMHVNRWYLAHITAWWDHPMQCSVHYDLVSIDWMVTALGVPDADENGCIRKGLWVFYQNGRKGTQAMKTKKERKLRQKTKWREEMKVVFHNRVLIPYIFIYTSTDPIQSKWIPPCDWMYNEHQLLRSWL